jgi:hypothetical protein
MRPGNAALWSGESREERYAVDSLSGTGQPRTNPHRERRLVTPNQAAAHVPGNAHFSKKIEKFGYFSIKMRLL